MNVKSDFNEFDVVFCGISKNCIKNINKNLDFLDNFSKNSRFNSYVILVDSDSIDGSKECIQKYIKKNPLFLFRNLDGLEDKFSNRIQRIQISRNKCLELIPKLTESSNFIYIPLDLDIDLFKFISINEFEKLIDYCISKNRPNAVFPFSYPYYYDIFALRSHNWVNTNSLFWVSKFKKYLKIGSFFYNYFFIFRHQITASKFDTKKNIKIRSAFGGIGIYKIEKKLPKYELSNKNPTKVSEHLKFNFHFEKLEILPTWKIPAPEEHLEYKLLNFKSKLKYFFKTIFFDFVKK